MPRIAITELWLKHAHNRVGDKPVEFTHEGVDFEFGVVINPVSKRYPKGTKTYFTRYPFPGAQRGRRQTLGRYPTVRLSEALERAKEVQRQAGRGVDPRQTPRQAPEHLTFGGMFEKYFEERSLKKSRPSRDRSFYNLYLRDWTDLPARDITRQMARDRFKEILDAGKPAQCNMVQYFVGAIFNWALDQELVDKNPIHRLPLQGKIGSRDRYLSDEEIRRLLPLLRDRRDWTAAVLHLMLLTGQRKAEVLKMRWSKIQDGCWWFLPRKIQLPDGREIRGTKNLKNHLVYLTSPALEILERQRAQPGPDSDWVFPKPSDPSLFRSRGKFYDATIELRDAVSSDDWKPHDIRRTFVTNLSRLGCPDKIKMAIVNHTANHVHQRVYDMWEHAPEKMHWMDRWVDFLTAIENGDDISEFLPYARPQLSSQAPRSFA